ncbi:MAG: alpha/beta family hydrolase [Ekhidna sp.]
MELFLNDKLGKITLETELAKAPKAVVILAHGAGAGMNHPTMILISKKLNESNFHCVRFNFPYMEQGRKSPGSPKQNIATWEYVIQYIQSKYEGLPLFISGKSYGGRMASHLIAENSDLNVKGLIYFGFPLHAPGKDSKDRASHLCGINVPQLFLQGVKDKLANIELMREVVDELPNAKLVEIEYADHSFNVPKKSGFTHEEIISKLANEVKEWT